MKRRGRIVLSAGETSGDRLGAGLAAALLRRRPDLELVGMGGERMEAAGVVRVQDSSEVAVVGLVEVLAHLPVLRRAMGRLVEQISSDADLLVPIDYPDFNLRLAEKASSLGVPVVYFVSPQVWAWRKGRIHQIRRLVRRMLVLFPFEVKYYEEAGVPVTHVGHPIAEPEPEIESRESFLSRWKLPEDSRLVALMPGSRKGEVERLLPTIAAAAVRLQRSRSKLRFVLPVAPGLNEERLHSLCRNGGLTDVTLHRGDFPDLLRHFEAGIVASGTASLEAACTGLPLVVVYRVSWLSYQMAKRFVNLESVSLPNLIAGKPLVPELIQQDCNAEKISAEVARYLDDPEFASETRARLRAVRDKLGSPGLYERAAEAVLAELDRIQRT